mmetsp:Transcript_27803/g.59450  ORF Transcript_27803/g.59450 Transcript_27803/m.59450 type:complete len:177 (-) Transcript_27803:503-1033(-)|eukprot:CAMPEP_0201121406 /NCGR_PEP_ID=MMETSP0850-20130426/5292_1 /ASSEMBLY_ACC=CAM_ASM_000622 /TAXON_ID=183588 /ORGANISM="Pseudo-nitzschia fraudulenta, Strain WWA7" /LENGTH=176 /DNA_ID=CAMNT_0047387847 /DNA_START=79 /DNA_END=609 /DNA_ORIENTATION=-
MDSDDLDRGYSSNESLTYGELPDLATELKSLGANKGGVQFKSMRSMEEVLAISRISNYNVEEITSYWGETDEHVLRKSELKQAVRDMYFQRRASDKDFTKLGIDDKIGEGKAVKKANRMLSRNAVMDEQNLQYHEGVIDDELMADVYSITSTAAKNEALVKAQRLHDALGEDDEQS